MATPNQVKAVTNAVIGVLDQYFVSKLLNEEKVAEQVTAAVIQAYELNASDSTKSAG
jgi:hypothetical protein